MPIGNAADITLRALHVLGLVDVIAAEDTRHSAPLLARYGIAKPLLAAHEHNEHIAASRLLEHLRQGARVAYISDAGTPGVCDPGAKIVDAVRAAGFAIIPIPGCTAFATALSVAGQWANTFSFIGFLPTKSKQRLERLGELAASPHTLIFYEAPHRIIDAVTALAATFDGSRQLLIARELTKLHETIHLCPLAEGPAWLSADVNRQRGEFVLLVEGARSAEELAVTQHDKMLRILLAEMSVSAAARAAAALTGTSRNTLYARALALQES